MLVISNLMNFDVIVVILTPIVSFSGTILCT